MDGAYLVKLNEPISFRVSALNGTNASVKWDFATANLNVIVQPINDLQNRVYMSKRSGETGFVETHEVFNK